MGLHFIKNGTKHDVCVKRPSLFPASATTYDNSQSGLSATRVQGAIDEIYDDLKGKVVFTSTANMTFAQQLAEIKPYYQNLTSIQKYRSALYRNGILYQINQVATGEFVYTGVDPNYINAYALRLLTETYYTMIHNVFTDASEEINNGTISLVLI